eukprot:gene19234-21874_t
MFASQIVQDTSTAQFWADPKAPSTFKAAIVAQVVGLVPGNILITNVTDVGVPSAYTRQSLLSLQDTSSVGEKRKFRTLSGGYLLISYSITFVAQRLLVTNSNPQTAFNEVVSSLAASLQTGAFNSALNRIALDVYSPAFLYASSSNAWDTLRVEPEYNTMV